MINNQKVYGLLGLSAKAGKIAFGTESCLDLIYKRKIKLVLLAEDSADRTINNFTNICREKNIPIKIFGRKETLSKSIGQTNKTVIGIRDKNFANAILKIIDGGETIG